MGQRNRKQTEREYYANPRGKPPGYVTVRRAMEIAQCSEPTIRRLMAKGRVRLVRWRYRTLLSEKDLQAWSRVRRYRRRPHRRSAVPPPTPVLSPPVATEEGQVRT
jgi:hypothetical protein